MTQYKITKTTKHEVQLSEAEIRAMLLSMMPKVSPKASMNVYSGDEDYPSKITFTWSETTEEKT